MKRIHFFSILMLLCPSAILFAAEGSSDAPRPVAVSYLGNEAYTPGPGYVVVRSAFEAAGPPHRWVALDVEFRLSQAVPLVRADGKMFLKRWNDLFLPESPRPARWTDCRLDVDFAELEKARNLPKGKTFVVWAMGLIFDYDLGKHIGSGWPVRVPLVLSTDEAGHIQAVLTPVLKPILLVYPSDNTIDALRMDIRTRHLKPSAGVRAYRVGRRGETPGTVLAGPRGQIWRRSNFGGAFETINSAEKALELVELQHPGGVILRTRGQYDAVVNAARKLGWPAEDLPQTAPEFPGPRITPIEGLGWRVEAILLEPRGDGLGDLAAWDYCVCSDGRLGWKRRMLLRGPGGKAKAPVSEGVYSAAVLSDLGGLSPEIIPPRICLTDEMVKFPLPADRAAEEFSPPAESANSSRASAKTSAEPEVREIFLLPDVRDAPESQAGIPTTRLADPTAQDDVITTPGPSPIRKSR
ncbi:MAG: hypothetical protein JW849_04505 [Phycisphaerae bacterium]|nr:hypothetical protein [Phycisphaerae bacterium]